MRGCRGFFGVSFDFVRVLSKFEGFGGFAQRALIKEYSLNHNKKPYII